MKSSIFLLAATLAVPLSFGTPLLAAPVAAAPAPVAPAAPQVDAKAIALLDQSMRAYAALDTLSQKFTIVDTMDGATQLANSGSGTLRIQSPDKARMDVKVGDVEMTFVGNKTTFISQDKPDLYEKYEVDNGVAAVAVSLPSAAPLLLNDLLSGRNPLTTKDGNEWEEVKIVSREGMSGVSMQLPTRPGQSPVTYQVLLDPETNLVARVEAATSLVKKAGEAAVPYSNVTTFVPDNGVITPAMFQYTPPADVRLMTEADRPKTYDAGLVIGAKPFALTGKTLDGKTISLDSYKGRVVLLDFWATWCGPCIGELPNLLTNYKNYHPWGLDIVGISLDDDESESTLRTFIGAKGMDWPQIYDGKAWESGDAATYGVKAIPFTLLIGKDGNIAAVNPRGEELEPAIRMALAK